MTADAWRRRAGRVCVREVRQGDSVGRCNSRKFEQRVAVPRFLNVRELAVRRPLTPVPARRRRPRKVSVSSIGATAGAAGPGSCWGTLCCRGGCLRAIWRRMSSVMPAMPNEWRTHGASFFRRE